MPDSSKDAALSLQQVVADQQEKIKSQEQYMQALIEEFANTSDFDDVRNKFRDELKKFAPTSLVNIINLANNAESESVRASLNKWILEWIMSDKIDQNSSDLQTLLKALSKPSSPTT